MLYLKIPELISDSITTQHGSVYKISKENYDKDKFKFVYKTNSRHKNKELVFESIIPKKIPLDTQTLNVIGLLEAEMTKRGTKNHIVFTNSESKLINEILDWFQKYFEIKRNQWKWLIEFNKKLVNYESYKETKAREMSSINFWVKNSKINKENHYPKWCVYRGLDEGSLETENKWGILIVTYGNTAIRKVVSDILKRFPEFIDKLSKRELSFYLNGLFCGEGGVSYSPKACVRRAFVSSYDEEILSRVQRALKKLNVDHNKSGHDIFISDCRSMFQLYIFNFFSLHPEKWLNFLKILLTYRQFQGRARGIEIALVAKKKEIVQDINETNCYLENRKKDFNTILNNTLKTAVSNFKMPMEVKLTGLALKPTRLVIAKETSIRPGITVEELTLKTRLTKHSVEHGIFRLAKQGYLIKKHFQPHNRILIFPSSKLLGEIDSSLSLRKQFTERYEIQADFHESLSN